MPFDFIKNINENVEAAAAEQAKRLDPNYVAKAIVLTLRDLPEDFTARIRALRYMGFNGVQSMDIVKALDDANDKAWKLAWQSSTSDRARDPTISQDIHTHMKRSNLYVWPFLYRHLQSHPVMPEDQEKFKQFTQHITEDASFVEWLEITSKDSRLI